MTSEGTPGTPATDPLDFSDEAKKYLSAHRKLRSKPTRTEQLEAFTALKEAARSIADKMAGGDIDWLKEEQRARQTIKRRIVTMVRDNEDWEQHPDRFKSAVTQQLWNDALVEIAAEMGPQWDQQVVHHSLAESSYVYKPRPT
jgi:hypothetical protein